ncbi:hypothetical protein HDU86_005690 [Geranomyces michiganensis]|nr:hypothetical protein HDU86_005690 [Geranomyces michiganensis]
MIWENFPTCALFAFTRGSRIFAKLFNPITGDEFDIGAGIEGEVVLHPTRVKNLQAELDDLLNKNGEVIQQRVGILQFQQALAVARVSNSDLA